MLAISCVPVQDELGGKRLFLTPKTLEIMLMIEIEVLDVYVVHFGTCLWWNRAQGVTETMQPPNSVENEPTSLANTTK